MRNFDYKKWVTENKYGKQLTEAKVQTTFSQIGGKSKCVCNFPNGTSMAMMSTNLTPNQCQQACDLKWQSMGGGTGKEMPDTRDLRYDDDMMDMDMLNENKVQCGCDTPCNAPFGCYYVEECAPDCDHCPPSCKEPFPLTNQGPGMIQVDPPPYAGLSTSDNPMAMDTEFGDYEDSDAMAMSKDNRRHTGAKKGIRGPKSSRPKARARQTERKNIKYNKKGQVSKSLLKKLIRESIKELVVEQTTAECQQIQALVDPASNYNFFTCCETTDNFVNYNPQQTNDPCKTIVAQASAINSNYAACCDPNYTGTTLGDCDDPLWVGMPVPNKNEYCNRCTEYGGGVAANGVYPVQLSAGSPYYTNDPNGLSYCHCCDGGTSGDIDCTNPEEVAQNPAAARKCFICQQAPAPCEQISNIPGMTVAIAQGMGLNLYNDQASCNSQTECGPSTGNRCDQMTQGVYDPDDPNHNDGWGMGCWFCHPEEGHPDFPGCTMITTPMSQWNAYQAYVAGTSGVYTTNAACQADPVTKCGDEDPQDMVSCQCCVDGDPVSMAQQVPSIPGCSVLNGGNTHGCSLHPISGGVIKDPCKKPGGGTSDIPVDDADPMPMVKPKSDREKRAIREAILKLLK